MQILNWQQLDAAERHSALARPLRSTDAAVVAQVQAIAAEVRRDGDAALRRYSAAFDGVVPESFCVSPEEFAFARNELQPASLRALDVAIANVETFHRAQYPHDIDLETQPGVRCERRWRPIQSVGLYVPAGSAPLPSTAIMLAVPARIACCPQRVLCTPPRRDGRADSAVLVAAQRCGTTQIFKVGGAQAIAAMAYGTESIPKVAKICGPGNRWVTTAKQLVAADPQGVALDMPAGPSEVCIIADESADADFVAADLLAQAEHDPDSHAVLLTASMALARRVEAQIAARMPALSRQEVLHQSLKAARLIVAPDLDTVIGLAEQYAPEHLLIQTVNPRAVLASITTAGSVFLGRWSPEPMGDYCSGTNHVLPTYGHARAYSGLSVGDFMRGMTVQELSPEGLRDLGPVAIELAQLEGLDAHAAAVNARLAMLTDLAERPAGGA